MRKKIRMRTFKSKAHLREHLEKVEKVDFSQVKAKKAVKKIVKKPKKKTTEIKKPVKTKSEKEVVKG